MNNPYQQLHDAGWPELAELGWRKLSSSTHGDLPGWLEAIDALPEGKGQHQLDRDAPALGRPVKDLPLVKKSLMRLHPWRKGPLELGVIQIDNDWRSDWK